MKILVACEESQAVTNELRKLGHEAYSNDILPCSGCHPEWHLKCDALELLKMEWDMIIAFPPCTYLTVTGNRWFSPKYGDKALKRFENREKAAKFFTEIYYCKCEKVAIENPVGVMSKLFRKPDQIIQPYFFGDPYEKKTCLWLKGLKKLEPTKIINPGERVFYKSGKSMPKWYADLWKLPGKERATIRSKTFPGIAKAMAEQWAGDINAED